MRERDFENRLIDAVAAQQIVDKVWPRLSDGQQIVAGHIMAGESKEEIAEDLGVSAQAISCTVDGISKKVKRFVGRGEY